MAVNNVTRLLEARNIQYAAHELPSEKLGALEAARLLNVLPEQVFKTIVLKRETSGKYILAVIPGDKEVDLKAVARCIGEKKVLVPTEREAEKITGLQAGGISPLALIHKGFQVLLDSSASNRNEIYISAGQRGLMVSLPVNALLTLTSAHLAEISS
jgi:Cys-tRNA(Pro)/Cys-tRNA(Cys) deacylase